MWGRKWWSAKGWLWSVTLVSNPEVKGLTDFGQIKVNRELPGRQYPPLHVHIETTNRMFILHWWPQHSCLDSVGPQRSPCSDYGEGQEETWLWVRCQGSGSDPGCSEWVPQDSFRDEAFSVVLEAQETPCNSLPEGCSLTSRGSSRGLQIHKYAYITHSHKSLLINRRKQRFTEYHVMYQMHMHVTLCLNLLKHI